MNIPTDSTVPADDDDDKLNFKPHLYQDGLDSDDQKRDLITDEAQTDSPVDLLNVPANELKHELDKQAIEGGGLTESQDDEDVEDYTTMVENSDLNSDDPDNQDR